ncbi:hypothetical protein BOX15_Mlig031027g2, partial [Macrostomum lignano]
AWAFWRTASGADQPARRSIGGGPGSDDEEDFRPGAGGGGGLRPRVVAINKSDTGFGFNVRGQVTEGGQLRSINGELFAPLQHVSAVLPGGAADQAGLLKGDRIIEVNGVNVEGSTHKQVVDLIKSGRDQLILTVISVPNGGGSGGGFGGGGVGAPGDPCLEPSDTSSGGSAIDYSDKRTLPVSIPDCQAIEVDNEKYVVFNVYMAGRHLCSHRYSDFASLHQLLRREFPDFGFPSLPGRWPFALSEQQLDSRRRGLEKYLERVCAVRVIAECSAMQEFLTSSDPHADVEMKVLLPDRRLVAIRCGRTEKAINVVSLVLDKAGLSTPAQQQQQQLLRNSFALFETEEEGFDRRVADSEQPHALYVQNYCSSAVSAATCLLLKRWLFSPSAEAALISASSAALHLLCAQAVEEACQGFLIQATPEMKRAQERLAEPGGEAEYLSLARQQPGYAEVAFPHCPCDARKEGRVIPRLGWAALRLQAADEIGAPLEQVIRFDWSDVLAWSSDEDTGCFCLQVRRAGGKPPRQIRLHTHLHSALVYCCEQIAKERLAENESG